MPHRTIRPSSGIVSAGGTAGGDRSGNEVPAPVPSSNNPCLGSNTSTTSNSTPPEAVGGGRLPPPLALSEPRRQTAMAEVTVGARNSAARIGTATDTRITAALTPRAPPVDPSQFDDAEDEIAAPAPAPPAGAAEAAAAPAPARTAGGVGLSSIATATTVVNFLGLVGLRQPRLPAPLVLRPQRQLPPPPPPLLPWHSAA